MRTAGALIALLAGALVTPTPSRADSCAFRHYLTSPDAALGSAYLDVLADVGALAGPDADDTGPAPAPVPAPTPCGSWRCQPGGPSGPSPLPPIPTPRADSWGLLAELSMLGGPGGGRLVVLEPAPRPIRRPTCLFRPPR